MAQMTDEEVAEVAAQIRAALDSGNTSDIMRLVIEAGEENLARITALVTPRE